MKRTLLIAATWFATMWCGSVFAADFDKTSSVSTEASAWGTGGYAATQYAPAITTADGRNAQMAEKYEETVTTTGELLSQTVSGLTNGTYTVVLYANAFYTSGRGFDSDVTEGAMDVAYVFANGKEIPVKAEIATSTTSNGEYTISDVEVTDGTLKLGLGKHKAGTNWHTIQIKSLTLSTSGDDAYTNALETAKALQGVKASADVMQELETALSQYGNVDATDEEALSEAAKALDAVSAKVKSSADLYAKNKAAIEARYALLESTNVCTQEAYKTFKDAADDYLAKYEAGTLTETVVNPNVHLGWHAANDYDDFLLSAWGEKDFESKLYINTWSVEGDDDGSEFKTPFFEYWTGDGNSLDVKTWTATVTGLEADKLYTVSAWVRVRIKNNAKNPIGITLSVGADGTPVDVTAGKQVGDSPFYLDNIVANGKADAEGNLIINFNIEEGNNISWLAFKNVNYGEYHISSNLDFSEGTPVDNGICTYAGDMAQNNTTYSQMQNVTGWNFGNENGDGRAAGVFAYGSEKWLGGKGYNVPATNPEGVAEGNALGLVSVWTATTSYTQDVTFPAGNYVINIPVYNAAGGTGIPVKSLIGFIADDGTEYLADAKAYPVDAWTTETVSFTLKKQTDGVLSLGYVALNQGSGANPHLFFDKVEITTISDAELALADLKKAIAAAAVTVEARKNVGDAIFQIPTKALDTYAAAVAAAQAVADKTEATEEELTTALATLNAATEAYATTSATAPKAYAEYTIKQNASGLYLTLNADKVSVETEAAPIKFEAVGDGTYYIVDADGEYVGYAGTDRWTLSTSADHKAAWTIASVSDGKYTIAGANGCIASDATDAGSSCFGDKSADSDKALWVIEEVLVAETSIDALTKKTGFAADETVTLTPKVEGVTNVEINIVDKTTEEYLTAMANMAKGEDGTFSYSFFHAIPFYEGHDYDVTFELYATETLEEGAEGPAPSKLMGTHTVTLKGLTEPFSFSNAKLTAITPGEDTEISAEEDLTVVLTFDSKVTPNAEMTFINEGQGMTSPFASQTSNEEGTEWTFVVSKDNFASKGELTLAFGFVDENGKVVEGNEGSEAQSYFMYVYSVASAGNVATDLVPSVVIPADETTVAELSTIELQFDQEVNLPQLGDMPEDAAILMQMRGNSVPVTIDYKGWDFTTVVVTLETPLKAGENDGVYVLTIKEGLIWDGAHENNNKAGSINPTLTYRFEVGEKAEFANEYIPESITPAAEGKYTSLKEFTLTFKEGTFVVDDSNAENIYLLNKADNSKVETELEYDNELFNIVKIVLKEEVTAAGSYTLVIPEGKLQQGSDEWGSSILDNAPARAYEFTVDPTVGVAGILADDAKADVYSVSGVLVLKNADRVALKNLKKGIYVINGKKVVVK